jgi:hypothetical protein
VRSLYFWRIADSSLSSSSSPTSSISVPACRRRSAGHVQRPRCPSAALHQSTCPPLPRRCLPNPALARFCSPHVAPPLPVPPHVPPALPAPAHACNAPPGLMACSAVALRPSLLTRAPLVHSISSSSSSIPHQTSTATTAHCRQLSSLPPNPNPAQLEHRSDSLVLPSPSNFISPRPTIIPHSADELPAPPPLSLLLTRRYRAVSPPP